MFFGLLQFNALHFQCMKFIQVAQCDSVQDVLAHWWQPDCIRPRAKASYVLLISTTFPVGCWWHRGCEHLSEVGWQGWHARLMWQAVCPVHFADVFCYDAVTAPTLYHNQCVFAACTWLCNCNH